MHTNNVLGTSAFHTTFANIMSGNSEKDFFEVTPKYGRSSAIATLALATAILTSTKVPDEGVNLAPVVSAYETAAFNLGVSSSFWVKNALTTLKARADGSAVGINLVPFDKSIVGVMKKIGTDDDMVTRHDSSPEQAFEFLSALIAESDLPDDTLDYVLDVYTGLAKHFRFESSVPFEKTKQALIDRLDAATTPNNVGTSHDHDVVSTAHQNSEAQAANA